LLHSLLDYECLLFHCDECRTWNHLRLNSLEPNIDHHLEHFVCYCVYSLQWERGLIFVASRCLAIDHSGFQASRHNITHIYIRTAYMHTNIHAPYIQSVNQRTGQAILRLHAKVICEGGACISLQNLHCENVEANTDNGHRIPTSIRYHQ
jgi:hypothetical protein